MNSLLLLAALTGNPPQPVTAPAAAPAAAAEAQDDDSWRRIRAERMNDIMTAVSKDEPIDRDDASWVKSEIAAELTAEKLYQTRRRVFEKALGEIKSKGMSVEGREILPPNAPDKDVAELAAVVADAVVTRYERDLRSMGAAVQAAKLKPLPKK
jgi:hypothetical protein